MFIHSGTIAFQKSRMSAAIPYEIHTLFLLPAFPFIRNFTTPFVVMTNTISNNSLIWPPRHMFGKQSRLCFCDKLLMRCAIWLVFNQTPCGSACYISFCRFQLCAVLEIRYWIFEALWVRLNLAEKSCGVHRGGSIIYLKFHFLDKTKLQGSNSATSILSYLELWINLFFELAIL